MDTMTTTEQPISRARKALRAAFVGRLVRQMKRSGVMAALFSASFTSSAVSVSPPHPCASGALIAILKPLCRSGVAAGGAGGGGPGSSHLVSKTCVFEDAATVLPLAA